MQPKDGKELGKNLAQFLQDAQWMVWTQLPLGPIGTTGIADVVAVAKSFSNVRINIYEVKVSRSDYTGDMNRGKFLSYFQHCTQFYFACPSGLFEKSELPEGCGLITLGDKGWHVVKAAPRREFKWTEKLLLKLLMRGYEDYFPRMRKLDRKRYETDRDLLLMARGKGLELAHRLRAAESTIQTAEAMKQRLAEALGREVSDLGEAIWKLEAEVKNLIERRTYAKEAVELATITMRLFGGQYVGANQISQRLREIATALEPKLTENYSASVFGETWQR